MAEAACPFAWHRYPPEFTPLILQHLSYKDLMVAEQVSFQWLSTGLDLQRTPKFIKDKYFLLFGEFIQVDDNCVVPSVETLTPQFKIGQNLVKPEKTLLQNQKRLCTNLGVTNQYVSPPN